MPGWVLVGGDLIRGVDLDSGGGGWEQQREVVLGGCPNAQC